MLPVRKHVRDLLEARTGREVTLSSDVPFAPSAHDRAAFAVYVDAQMRTRALLALDLAMATLSGAALAELPVGRALAERRQRVLSGPTARQVDELLEDLGSLLQPPQGVDLRLYDTYLPGAEVPLDLPAYAHTPGHRLDLRVVVAGYGSGRLSVVCPPVIPSPRQGESLRRPAALR